MGRSDVTKGSWFWEEPVRWRGLLLSPFFVAVLVGCAGPTSYRTHGTGSLHSIKTVALLPPDVKVYRLTAGEERIPAEEWSETARGHIAQSIGERAKTSERFIMRDLDVTQSLAAQKEWEDARALFEAVVWSAVSHTYAGWGTILPRKAVDFKYSLGPLPALAEAGQADALLFVYARDDISTAGRHLKRVALGVGLGLAGIALGAAAGQATAPTPGAFGVINPAAAVNSAIVEHAVTSTMSSAGMTAAGRYGQTLVAAALVRPQTGDVVWFSARPADGREAGAYDLRKARDVGKLVGYIFEDWNAASLGEKQRLLLGGERWARERPSFSNEEFQVRLPALWGVIQEPGGYRRSGERMEPSGGLLLLTRDGLTLNSISIEFTPLPTRASNNFSSERTEERPAPSVSPGEAVEIEAESLRSQPGLLDLEILEKVPAPVAGKPGFRLVYSWTTQNGLRVKRVLYGLGHNGWTYRLAYQAPARYYFERELATFEQVRESFRLKDRP